jgi:hypothetical protein
MQSKMATKKCEKCGLINPPDRTHCDCGHHLGSPFMKRSGGWLAVLSANIGCTVMALLVFPAVAHLVSMPFRFLIDPTAFLFWAFGAGQLDSDRYERFLQATQHFSLLFLLVAVLIAQVSFYLWMRGANGNRPQR